MLKLIQWKKRMVKDSKTGDFGNYDFWRKISEFWVEGHLNWDSPRGYMEQGNMVKNSNGNK